MAVDVREAAVGAVVAEHEAFVVDAEEVEHGGVEIVGRDDIVRGFPGPLVARAVGDAGSDSGPGHRP